jgi:hypothetical protein
LSFLAVCLEKSAPRPVKLAGGRYIGRKRLRVRGPSNMAWQRPSATRTASETGACKEETVVVFGWAVNRLKNIFGRFVVREKYYFS